MSIDPDFVPFSRVGGGECGVRRTLERTNSLTDGEMCRVKDRATEIYSVGRHQPQADFRIMECEAGGPERVEVNIQKPSATLCV